jgi:glycosyltransferase involved in cell wall biosynthesis
VCLSLRNFRPYSNLDIVLRAFAQARQEVPQLRLFSSAGGGWTREEFDRLAAELGVEPYMAVQDVHASELPSVTASADFAVTLADVDSSPASLLETMASAVPLVVGRAPSMEEWIQQGEGGEIVDRHDVEAVAAAMVRLARDPELRRRYGDRNLREVHARFNDPTSQLEQVYRDVLGR